MPHGCPITRAYLAQIERQTDFKHPLHEWSIPRFEDVLELAAASSPSPALTHHRAFYALEYMTLRSLVYVKAGLFVKSNLIEWGRSREGLNKLLEIVVDIIQDSVGELSELQFTNRLAPDSAIPLRLQTLASVYTLIRDSAVTLRRSLKNEKTPLRGVGRRAAKVSYLLGIDLSTQFAFAGELLALTEEWAPRAWELKKK